MTHYHMIKFKPSIDVFKFTWLGFKLIYHGLVKFQRIINKTIMCYTSIDVP